MLYDSSTEYETQKGRIKKPSPTISNPKRFEGRTGLHCVGGVNKVQGRTENPRQNVAQLFPRSIHAAEAEI